MATDNRITLECTECKQANYFEHKNSKIKGRLQKMKFCSGVIGKNKKSSAGKEVNRVHAAHHVMHKETK